MKLPWALGPRSWAPVCAGLSSPGQRGAQLLGPSPPGPRGGHAAQLADPRPGAHRRGGPHAAWAAAAGASAFRVDQADLPPSSVLEWALRGHPQQARPARGA